MDDLKPSNIILMLITLIVAILVTQFLFLHGYKPCFDGIIRMKPLPFMSLPPEVRLQIYQNIIDRDPSYPVQEQASTSFTSRLTQTVHKRIRMIKPTGANLILLANRQIHAEYIAVLCKTATFKLTLDDDTYLSSSNHNHKHNNSPIWELSPAVYKQIKRCDLRIVADPSIIGSHDMMEGGAARLARRVAAALSYMPQLMHLTVHIHALTNPLLFWFHASQAFKVYEGLPLQRVSLSSDCKTMGENHLARCSDNDNDDDGAAVNNGERWEWRCPENHYVVDGLSGKQPIRGFCAALYMDCNICS